MNWDYDFGHDWDSNFWRIWWRIEKQESDANILAIDWEARAALINKPWEAWFAPQVIRW